MKYHLDDILKKQKWQVLPFSKPDKKPAMIVLNSWLKKKHIFHIDISILKGIVHKSKSAMG